MFWFSHPAGKSAFVAQVQPVADTAHGLDIQWVAWVFFKLLPQPAHVNIQGAGIFRIGSIPNMAEELFALVQAVEVVVRQASEELELLVGQEG